MAQFGAVNIVIRPMQGFAKFDVHEPYTVTADDVAAAMTNANYKLTRIEITARGKAPVTQKY